ncbi:SUKH-4 family immunity protein [Paenibacillus sp. JNUCC32]|uniref:SUKH-4 family immunity protein n=1 Tax=Paenibacillus sp. JNUCC32 TaxID=2777984 RepID=UPI001787CE07|nr:SUKH-4 family immunity protein [Paenibacillus sp. JNUCC-32]QOT11119.1 SUKH-4 family immunity protein [Paenibacillus sp. JNUCC-32]
MEPQYHTLYDHGVLPYTRESLDVLGMHDKTVETLVHRGMPVFDPQEPPLGLLFHEALPLQDIHGAYIAIGREIWSEGLHVAIQKDTGGVWAVTEGGTQKPTYINASIDSLLSFMDRVLRFKQQTERLQPDPPPMILTAEQFREKLEKFRRGEIKPGTRPDASQAQHEWKSAFELMKRELKEMDLPAVRSSSWWGIVLEEMKDRLR